MNVYETYIAHYSPLAAFVIGFAVASASYLSGSTFVNAFIAAFIAEALYMGLAKNLEKTNAEHDARKSS